MHQQWLKLSEVHFAYNFSAGTNLQALIDAQNTPALPDCQIVRVISNRKAAYGLQRAANAKPPIPTSYLALQPYLKAHPGASRDEYDAEIARLVLQEQPDLVVLAGWMHVLGERFLDALSGDTAFPPLQEGGEELRAAKPIPVINLHPALPGAFDGANAIERAFEAYKNGEITKSGAMVHRVIKEVDRGEPLVVREIAFNEDDTMEKFEERLHSAEWEIIVEATAKALHLEDLKSGGQS